MDNRSKTTLSTVPATPAIALPMPTFFSSYLISFLSVSFFSNRFAIC